MENFLIRPCLGVNRRLARPQFVRFETASKQLEIVAINNCNIMG